MGKLLLTNNTDWDARLKGIFSDSGFKEKGAFLGQFNLTTYRKLNVDNENYYSQNEDYVASAGTVIYKNAVGLSALQLILDDFDGDVQKIRKDLSGCYLLVIQKNNKITAFVDEQNIYAAYYHYDGKKFLLTTTYYHIQRCINSNLDPMALLEYTLTFSFCDNSTIFSGISQLMGAECIAIDLLTSEVHIETVKENRYSSETTDFKTQLKLISERAVDYAKKKKLFNETVWQFSTGGVDTRIALAINLKAGIKPCIVSWHGDNVDIQSYDDDTKHAAMLAEAEHLPLRTFDVSRNLMEELDHIYAKKLEKYGEHALIYGGHPKWFRIFEEENVTFAEFGSYGETLKIFDGFEYHTPMTVADYAKVFLDRLEISLDSRSKINTQHMVDYLTEKLLKIAEAKNMDADNLTFGDCLYFYRCYHTRSGEAGIFNFANMFAYGWDVLSQKELGDYIYEIDYKKKEQRHLHLCLINEIWPRLLDVSFFTHCHNVMVDKESLTLTPPVDESYGSKIRHYLKPVLSKMKLGRMVIEMYREHSNSYGQDTELVEKYVNLINKLGIYEKCGAVVNTRSFVQMPVYRSIFRHSVMILFLSDESKIHTILQP